MGRNIELPRTAAKRAQIRAAAQSLFLQHGFMRTSTAAIAAAARVSKETLYKHYPTKEELLGDVLRHSIKRLSDQAFPGNVHGAIADTEALRRALQTLAEQLIGVLMQPDYLSLARIIIAEAPHAPHLGQLFRSTVPEQVLGRVAAMLELAQQRNLVSVSDTDAAARLFVGALLTYVLMDGLLVEPAAVEPPGAERIAPIVELYTRAVQR